MKKLILLTGILLAGFVSAENVISKNEAENTSKEVNKTISNTAYESKAALGACVTYTSECGVVAQTCATEGKSLADLIQWANSIEENYCAPGAPYSNTSGLD